MSEILALLSLLTATEKTKFILYLKARNKRSDIRNIDLFKAYLVSNQSSIKKEIGDNAFHALNNRLKERLVDFLASSTLENEQSDDHHIWKRIAVARRLLKSNVAKLGFKLLKKEEENALEIEHFGLALEICSVQIEYSYLENAPDIDYLIKKSESIRKAQGESSQINLAHAIVQKAYRAVEFEQEAIDISQLIKTTFDRLGISDSNGFSFPSIHRLIQLSDIHGAYRNDYSSVDLFFVEKLRFIQGGKNDNEKNIHHHIGIVYTIANIYFRQKKFLASLEFLEEMNFQMLRFDSKYATQYQLQYTMLSALNNNLLGKWELAESDLQQALRRFSFMGETLQIRLVLAMIQFQQKKHSECRQTLSKFSKTDSWYERQAGVEWTLHKLTMEILLHIELENYDFAESRLNSMFRKYKTFLSTNGKDQIRPFLRLIQEIIRNPFCTNEQAFQDKIESSIEWKTFEEEDVFRINFYAWLKAKIQGADLYQTTLSLVSPSQI